jgi:hypothetical protein
VKRGDERRFELPQQWQDKLAGVPAKNAKLVLEADRVKRSAIQDCVRGVVLRRFVVVDLKPDCARIGVAIARVVHRDNRRVNTSR